MLRRDRDPPLAPQLLATERETRPFVRPIHVDRVADEIVRFQTESLLVTDAPIIGQVDLPIAVDATRRLVRRVEQEDVAIRVDPKITEHNQATGDAPAGDAPLQASSPLLSEAVVVDAPCLGREAGLE